MQVRRGLLLLLALFPGVVHAWAPDRKLCRAVLNLKQVAKTTRVLQQVSILNADAMSVGCERRNDAGKAFCDLAIGEISWEFTHGFPWQIYDCLVDWGLTPQIRTVHQYTGLNGRRKLTNLSAVWSDGTRIDVRFLPRGDFGDSPEYKDYWGEYRMEITPR